jgi:hypothetical protein
MMQSLKLTLLPERFAVVQIKDPAIALPLTWEDDRHLHAIIQTSGETTLVCLEAEIPEGLPAESGWRALEVSGPLAFELTGILASIAVPLAQAGVSIFALSTYSTDIVLIKETALPQASSALQAAGHILL